MQRKIIIEKLVPGGLGLARTAEGVVLVRGGLPGEEVLAELESRKDHLEGYVLELLVPSPEREQLPGLPPGADLPVRYETQLELKRGLVAEALSRIGKLNIEMASIVPSPRTLGYRTAAQFVPHPLGGLAYRELRSHQPVQIKQDATLAAPLAEALTLLNTWPIVGLTEVVLRGSLSQDRVQVGLIGGHARWYRDVAQGLVEAGIAGVVWGAFDTHGRFRGPSRHMAGAPALSEDYGGIEASIDVTSFAQINPLAATALYQEAVGLVSPGKRLLELYAGGGILSLHLASRFEEVHAVEINRTALGHGYADAKKLGYTHVRFHRANVNTAEVWLPADLIVADPPRSGLDAKTLALIAGSGAAEILYISCDPSTFARDARRLTDAGYTLAFLRPYDFYPYTHHVELLSLFKRS